MRCFATSLGGLCMLGAVLVLPGTGRAADPDTAARLQSRIEQLRGRLGEYGPRLNLRFKQSESNPAVFTATLETGLKYADRMIVIARVTEGETLTIAGFPQLAGRYVNLRQAVDERRLLRLLARLTLQSFFFWGADSDDDITFGFVFTLEDGMPRESLRVVLASVVNMDQAFGREIRPLLVP